MMTVLTICLFKGVLEINFPTKSEFGSCGGLGGGPVQMYLLCG